MLRNCIYHLCDDAVPLFHVRKRRFPIQLPGLSKNHESERNQLMKKSNRKKFLQFVVLVLFLAALFVPQDANRLLIAGIALIGIGVTLFSYLLPLFTERLKNREHKLRKRPERTRHLEGTPDLETILWRQIKFQITGKLKEAFPDATWDFVKEPPLSQILDGEPLRIRTRNTGSYNFAEILMDARGSLTLQMMTIESLTSALIDDSNRHLIGTETNDRSYIILKDGVYTNEKGKVVDIEELAKSSSEFPESRIVKSSLMPNFIPSSIVEIPTDKSDEMYIIPEIILINNSLCVLTQDNGKGWELTDKDNIVISFDKYKSDITVSQDLIIGYVKDGIMYEGEVFDELSGKYSFSPDEKGEYFFYLLSGSSDYLSLKSGNLEVN